MSTQPITREKWSEQEHNLFVEGFERYKRDWKKVSEHVKTKNIVQTKLHAQLYFKHTDYISPESLASSYLLNPSNIKNWTNLIGANQIPNFQLKQEPFYKQVETLDGKKLQEEMDAHINSVIEDNMPKTDDTDDTLFVSNDQMVVQEADTTQPVQSVDDSRTPNYEKIYAVLGCLFDPTRHDSQELMNELSACDRECLKVLLHNMSVTLSSQLFQEEYSEAYTKTHLEQMQNSSYPGLNGQQSGNLFINIQNGSQTQPSSNEPPTQHEETTNDKT